CLGHGRQNECRRAGSRRTFLGDGTMDEIVKIALRLFRLRLAAAEEPRSRIVKHRDTIIKWSDVGKGILTRWLRRSGTILQIRRRGLLQRLSNWLWLWLWLWL